MTLDNFGIIGFLFFGRIPVDSSHFSLHFDSILSPKAPKYFILNVLKRSLILDQRAADSFEEECSVLNITLLVGPTAFYRRDTPLMLGGRADIGLHTPARERRPCS